MFFHPHFNEVGVLFCRMYEGLLQGGYKIRNQASVHFLTFTVVGWVDVFTRQIYRNILLDSFRHCQEKRGLLVHSWCIMSNHLHLVASAKRMDLSDIVRDYKTFTSKKIVSAIESNPGERRKDWMLPIFKNRGEENSRNNGHQFWIQNNHPEELYSAEFTFQKINYIHQNPVKAGIVENPSDYLYSSARDYERGKKCGLLDISFL